MRHADGRHGHLGRQGAPDRQRRAHAGLTSWNNSGFLAWDSNGKKNNPPGESNPANLNTAFQNMIAAVGEHGCGYEASLESWYRFLVDPEPPVEVVLFNGQTWRGTVDTAANRSFRPR